MANNNIVVIDNYDSFTYNLVQMIEQIVGEKIDVIRNDQLQVSDMEKYDTFILSPGPGIPEEAGQLKEIIATYAPTKKILGVCLGQQAIGEVFGGKLKNLDDVYHGVKTEMHKTEYKDDLLEGIGDSFEAGRYHSWTIDQEGFPDSLEITCRDDNGEIMGIKHKSYKVYAVQFHPESILTPDGKKMLENFINNC